MLNKKYTKEGKPLFCSCGSKKLKEENPLFNDFGQIESYSVSCQCCGKTVGEFDNGQWDKSYMNESDKDLINQKNYEEFKEKIALEKEENRKYYIYKNYKLLFNVNCATAQEVYKKYKDENINIPDWLEEALVKEKI